jgi:hypothetical protein
MKHSKILLVVAASLVLQACSNNADESAVAGIPTPSARVFIVAPANGSTVTSPVTVEFGLEGYVLAPAGTYEVLTGHHHLLVDTDLPALDAPIPSDENHLHFGKAQTTAEITLTPGDHTLQLLLGDGSHMPHSTALISDPLVITVVAETDAEAATAEAVE